MTDSPVGLSPDQDKPDASPHASGLIFLVGRRALHPLGPIAAQLAGQLVNLGSQTLLLAGLGAALYADIAFAMVIAISALYLGELGYSSEFLRARTPEERQSAWRIANFHRLSVGMFMAGALLAVWTLIYGPDAPGTLFLLLAAPGLVLNGFNALPLLYGTERPRLAALSIHARWLVHGGGMAAAAALQGPVAALACGAAFSLGIMAQLLTQIAGGVRPGDLLPTPSLAFTATVRSAGSIWLLGLLGILSDRLVFILFEAHRPEMMAVILLLLQITGGISGLVTQVERIAVPLLSNRAGERPRLARHLRQTVRAGYGLMQATGLIVLWVLWHEQTLSMAGACLIILLLAEWMTRGTGSAVYWQALAEGRHPRFLAGQAIIQPVSLALQVLAASLLSLEAALIIRVVTAVGTLFMCGRVVGLGLPLWDISIAAASIAAALLVR